MHAKGACSNPNQQQCTGTTVLWFCLTDSADQQKAMEIPGPQNEVALKQLLYSFFLHATQLAKQLSVCLVRLTAIRKLWAAVTVTHFKLETSSDVSGGPYQLTNGHAHGVTRYILLWKKTCGLLANTIWIRIHHVWLPLPKAALHHSQ